MCLVQTNEKWQLLELLLIYASYIQRFCLSEQMLQIANLHVTDALSKCFILLAI